MESGLNWQTAKSQREVNLELAKRGGGGGGKQKKSKLNKLKRSSDASFNFIMGVSPNMNNEDQRPTFILRGDEGPQ